MIKIHKFEQTKTTINTKFNRQKESKYTDFNKIHKF